MPLLAIIAAIAFIAGFGLSHQFDKAELKQMSNDIAAKNTLAETTLREKTNAVEAATATAIKLKSDLDKSRDSFLATTIDYSQRVDAIGLYSKSWACSDSPTTGRDPTGISENSPSEAEFSAELDRLVKEKAKLCDLAADYADKAYQFTTLNNCGIAR
jgi:hypothetical protein